MAKFTGINAYLNVSNTEKSRAFYEGLGFQQKERWDEFDVASYDAGAGTTIMIGPAQSPDPKVQAWLAQKPWGVGVILTQNTNNVDQVYELAKKISAEVEQPPTTQPWGDRTLQLVDPDGYSVWFTQPAKAPAVSKPKPKAAARKVSKTANKAKPKAAPKNVKAKAKATTNGKRR